jgi:hypothetical protein
MPTGSRSWDDQDLCIGESLFPSSSTLGNISHNSDNGSTGSKLGSDWGGLRAVGDGWGTLTYTRDPIWGKDLMLR